MAQLQTLKLKISAHARRTPRASPHPAAGPPAPLLTSQAHTPPRRPTPSFLHASPRLAPLLSSPHAAPKAQAYHVTPPCSSLLLAARHPDPEPASSRLLPAGRWTPQATLPTPSWIHRPCTRHTCSAGRRCPLLECSAVRVGLVTWTPPSRRRPARRRGWSTSPVPRGSIGDRKGGREREARWHRLGRRGHMRLRLRRRYCSTCCRNCPLRKRHGFPLPGMDVLVKPLACALSMMLSATTMLDIRVLSLMLLSL